MILGQNPHGQNPKPPMDEPPPPPRRQNAPDKTTRLPGQNLLGKIIC